MFATVMFYSFTRASARGLPLHPPNHQRSHRNILRVSLRPSFLLYPHFIHPDDLIPARSRYRFVHCVFHLQYFQSQKGAITKKVRSANRLPTNIGSGLYLKNSRLARNDAVRKKHVKYKALSFLCFTQNAFHTGSFSPKKTFQFTVHLSLMSLDDIV